MRAGQRGPRHVADREQVWVGLEGELAVQLDDPHATTDDGERRPVPRAQ